jgi:molecular chaperone DnaK (HSP70)
VAEFVASVNDRIVTNPALTSAANEEPQRPRFVAGIDLGTTNSALCYVDTESPNWRIETFAIPQIVGPGQVENLETLPSFYYEALPEERSTGATRLPWSGPETARSSGGNQAGDTPTSIVGQFARDHGRTIPGRMIESAKSWLCHNGVDRKAALLPWHGAADVQRMSPVEVSASYLRHLREAWNCKHPAHPLEQQDVVLTIPASFDEVARELTVAAARLAGLPRVVLLEEPQAAFYSWVDAHRDEWEQSVSPGQKILVCDIGGGTSDFSLIHVRAGDEGRLQFHRVAVGDHLLLGGDNLDLALAHFVEPQLAGGGRLDARQWSMLIPACRHAKEILLGENSPASHTVVIAGGGSRLIGGSLQAELTREAVLSIFLEGFLPSVNLDEKPTRRQSGFQEFGLPYAADPAITKYLAAFLTTHASVSDPDSPYSASERISAARPDVVLFNGGFFASPLLRTRLIESLERWFRPYSDSESKEAREWTPLVLRNDRLDLAVARGAAYFGMVRRGVGIRIVAGLARTYYIGIEQADGTRAALCLVSAGTEASAEPTPIDRTFKVRTSEPVEFPILVSGTRLTDKPGQIIPFDPDQLTSLPPIRTVLTTRKRGDNAIVDARLSAMLTEIGTMELWCEQIDGTRRWQLQFDVRSATETDRIAHTGRAEQSGIVDQEMISAAAVVLQSIFGSGGDVRPDEAMKRLAEVITLPRSDWPPSLLRAIWSELIELNDGRRQSPQHESRWLNLVGFCLRPGFGMAADDWRVEETWRITNGRLVHSVPACLAELRTLCRRISGGLAAGRQNQIASTVLPAIRQRFRQAQTGRGKAAPYASGNHEAAEIWRMLGSLELLEQNVRLELGEMIADLMNRAAFEPVQAALIWALGRVGGRVPVYGPLNLVLPVSRVADWIEQLLRTSDLNQPAVQLAIMQLSRRTDDRFRDISTSLRDRIINKLSPTNISKHLLQLVADGGVLEGEEASLILGESLPAGLRLA